jgi:hypothetical protein
MGMLDDLINKQKLIGDYLEVNYTLSREESVEAIPIPSTSRFGNIYTQGRRTTTCEIRDKVNGGKIYGKQLELELQLFFPFGKGIITTVINEWLKGIGLTRNNSDWINLLNPPSDRRLQDFNIDERFINQNIEDGPIRLQTSIELSYDYRHRGNRYGHNRNDREIEAEYVRGIARNIAIELADENGVSQLLSRCVSISGLEESMRRIGFERFEDMDMMTGVTTLRFREGNEAYAERRVRHYNRVRRDGELEIMRERLHTQRGMIEANHAEREARLNHQVHMLERQQQEVLDRLSYEQLRNDNTRRNNLF